MLLLWWRDTWERATINTLILDYSTVLSWQHIQSLLFSLGLCFCILFIFLARLCLFACFQCLCECFIRQAPDYPWTLPKKTLQGRGCLCVWARSVWSAHKKAFLFELVHLFLCHHKFFLVSFFLNDRVSEWVSEARSDWRLWDKGERERQRDEPGYEEDTDSAWASTNRIMHLTTM